jgi:Tfp pilus assembly protein PilF
MLGMVELKENEIRKAFGAFSKAVELDPDLLDAQAEMGKIMLLARDRDGAKKKADLVLSKDPDHIQGRLLKAGLLMADQKEGEAASILTTLMKETPVHLALARAHLLNDETGLAEETYKKIIEQNPKVRQAHLGLIDLYRRKGKGDLIKQQLEKMLEIAPDDRGTLTTLGDLALRQRNLEKALQIDPDFVPALNQILSKHVRDQKIAKALERCHEQIDKG